MPKRIYLDYAAATPVDPEVRKVMERFLNSNYGNASGIYKEGREAKKALNDARASIAEILSHRPGEIIFTSGGTESNNLAILGVTSRNLANGEGGHIITSAFEHRSVLEPIKELERRGFDITYIKISRDGFFDPKDIEKELRDDTILISLMYVNNEIGTIQPITEVGKIVKMFREKNKSPHPYLHTDACQAANYLDLNMDRLGVDLASFSGAKVYGPKGVGFLYKKEGVLLRPEIFGGGQEMGFRSGTEPLSQIVGLAKAFEVAKKRQDEEVRRLKDLRDYFAKEITLKVEGAEINGDLERRIPSNLSVSFLDVDSEPLIVALDENGIAVSSGSACDARLPELPHVIMALGKGEKFAKGVIRFSLGAGTERKDIEYVLEVLPDLVNKLKIQIYERNKTA